MECRSAEAGYDIDLDVIKWVDERMGLWQREETKMKAGMTSQSTAGLLVPACGAIPRPWYMERDFRQYTALNVLGDTLATVGLS